MKKEKFYIVFWFWILIKSLHFPGEETLIMMTKDFDPISEFPFHSEEFGEGMPSLEYMLTFYTISYFHLHCKQ